MPENIKLLQLIQEEKRQVNAVCLLNVGKMWQCQVLTFWC
jgi:hypothetical protein